MAVVFVENSAGDALQRLVRRMMHDGLRRRRPRPDPRTLLDVAYSGLLSSRDSVTYGSQMKSVRRWIRILA